MIRHFTSTGIVAIDGAALVHWHARVQAWLAPGGHIEPNEDPVQATIREVKEETGLDVRILPTSSPPEISNLAQIITPFTVMVEDVTDEKHGPHQHIDFIYFTTPVGEAGKSGGGGRPAVPDGWHWVTRDALVSGSPLMAPDGQMVAPPEDVLKLSISALDLLEKDRASG
ncbi:MAG: NUDIX domain-containing protein [Chloroflexi bacterium]|nr:NUDIX domain-containing protein [Chloroflexota bacterium]